MNNPKSIVQEIRSRAPYPYVMGKYDEPLAKVAPGETIALYTEDAFEGRLSAANT
jgi:amidase